jgi:steroid 5-alpha reductase family enzyme
MKQENPRSYRHGNLKNRYEISLVPIVTLIWVVFTIQMICCLMLQLFFVEGEKNGEKEVIYLCNHFYDCLYTLPTNRCVKGQ